MNKKKKGNIRKSVKNQPKYEQVNGSKSRCVNSTNIYSQNAQIDHKTLRQYVKRHLEEISSSDVYTIPVVQATLYSPIRCK